MNIQLGEELEFINVNSPNSGEKCIVVNDKQVKYKDEIWSLFVLATTLSNSIWPVSGACYFK